MFAKLIVRLFFISVLILLSSPIHAQTTEFTLIINKIKYHYTVIPTGDNYTFKFDKSPATNQQKIIAGRQVLMSIYKDQTINTKQTESYIRERARCHVFDSRFYSYTLCFLPNDFSTKNKHRFWGFVTQIPNAMWLITRLLIPVLVIVSLVFYFTKNKQQH